MFWTGKCLGILLASLAGVNLQAQTPAVKLADIPAVDRDAPDFYGALAKGSDRVSVTWTVDPEVVPLDGTTILRLRIEPVVNPDEVRRPALMEMPEFYRLFQIEARGKERPGPEVVVFCYHLRPRQAGVLAIPSLKFRYYRPGFPEPRRFQTTYARSIAVTVTPAMKAPEVSTIRAPAAFFQLVPEPSTTVHVSPWAWLIPLGCTPLLALLGVILTRWLFPTAARRDRNGHISLARKALIALAQAGHDVAPARAVAATVIEYLQRRIPLTGKPRTTEEVLAALAASDWPEHRRTAVAKLLQRCDAARYSGSRDDAESLAAFAQQLIRSWED